MARGFLLTAGHGAEAGYVVSGSSRTVRSVHVSFTWAGSRTGSTVISTSSLT
jgi:hypothetical protein